MTLVIEGLPTGAMLHSCNTGSVKGGGGFHAVTFVTVGVPECSMQCLW